MKNLLTEPILAVQSKGGKAEHLSLCGLFAALAKDEIECFPALRPHQKHAWHAFLAQLATIALHESAVCDEPDKPEDWLFLLRALTNEFPDDQPWHLVVEDFSSPAFMQCPCPEGLSNYRNRVDSPDDLDVLVTAKNHDVKRTMARGASVQDWIFALVSLQTMAGFLGQGNYGIARMNGGFSSRPCVGLFPDTGRIGGQIFHDVKRMIQGRDSLLAIHHSYQHSNGLKLLWLQAWNGETSLGLRDLDPYFIEICRRVRMSSGSNGLIARTAASKVARIESKAMKGVVGDFWTPIVVDEKQPKALSISSQGFTYKKLADILLFDKFKCPPSMDLGDAAASRWRLVARGTAAGQGKTEGYHERTNILFSPKTARTFFGSTSDRDTLASVCTKLLDEISFVSNAIWRGAMVAASHGKLDESSDAAKSFANTYRRSFDKAVDAKFFIQLDERFNAVSESQAKARNLRKRFARDLIDAAESILEQAIETAPLRSIHRHRARENALRAFHGTLRNPKGVFSDQPEIFEKETPAND